VEEDTPASVATDPRRLARVLTNLLDNADRHGSPPVAVRVCGARIDVLDRGPGFSDALLSSATERFTKGDAARSGGTGLGLAIAAAQARVIGASLEVRNRPDGGGVVTVRLPDGEPPVIGAV
jgi:signal transduction histidine kinase